MALPLQIARRRPPHPHRPKVELDYLTLCDVLQRLAALNPEKVNALDVLARSALMEELSLHPRLV